MLEKEMILKEKNRLQIFVGIFSYIFHLYHYYNYKANLNK